MKIKVKNKTKLCLLIVFAFLLCVFATLFTFDNKGKTASANVDGTQINLGSGTNGFSADGLKQLFKAISGQEGASYKTLKDGLTTKNAAQISSYVTLGGLNWNVVYASKDDSGNVISTLWLADSTFSANWSYGWCSDYSGVGVTSNVTYPCNYYSTSYIRSFLTGSKYAYVDGYNLTNTGSSVGNVVTKLSTTGAQNTTFSTFIGGYSKYIITPSKVGWQKTERAVNYISGYTSNDIPNESAAIISGASWGTNIKGTACGTMNYTGIGSAGNGTSGSGTNYTAWASDYLWLPSLTETGYTGAAGIWNLNTTQRQGNGFTWLRSATYNDASQARNLGSTGGNSGGGPRYALICRPAFHLNLKEAAKAAGLIVEDKFATEQAEGITLSNANKTATAVFNTEEQSAVLSFGAAAIDEVTVTADRTVATAASVEDNVITAVDAATYTLSITLNAGYCWSDETTAAKTLTFIIKPKTVTEVFWEIPSAFIYDGNSKLVELEAYYVNLYGRQVTLDLESLTGYDGTSAGEQKVTAVPTDKNYAVVEGETVNAVQTFNISKATINLTWSEKSEYFFIGTKQQPEVTATTDNYDGKLTFKTVVTSLKTGGTVDEAVNIGKYKIEIVLTESADNYVFDKSSSMEFEIIASPDNITIHWENLTFDYDGKAHLPTAYYTVNGDEKATKHSLKVFLVAGTDGIDLGTHKAEIIIDTDNFDTVTGDTQKGFEIVAVRISIGWTVSDYIYDGNVHKPTAYYTVTGDSNRYRLEVKLSEGFDGIAIGAQQAEIVELPYGYSIYAADEEEELMQTTCGYLIYKKVLTVTWDTEGNYTYNGSAQSPVAGVEDEEETLSYTYATASGEKVEESVNADDYVVKVSADEEYVKLDPDTCEYTINKAKLEKPVATVAEFENVENAKDYLPQGYDANTMILTGIERDGKYVVTVALKDAGNYEWTDGGAEEVNFVFDITHSDLKIVDNGNINWLVVGLIAAIIFVALIAFIALILAIKKRRQDDDELDEDGFYEPYLG